MKPPMAHKINIPRPWVPSAATDISKTFARIRKQQAEAQKKVQPIKPHIRARVA